MKIPARSDTAMRVADTVAAVVHVVQPGALARLIPVALASVLAAGACTTLSGDLAFVPGVPQAQSPAPAHGSAAAPTPAPRGAAFAPPTARAVVPAPTPVPSTPARGTPPSADQDVRQTVPDKVKRKKPKVLRLRPRPAAGPFRMNLFERGDFMHQATKDMCVAGSTQIMMNIIDEGKPNRSVAYQKRLYQRGRALSPNKAKLGPIGVDLTGWAALLNTNGYGPYVVESATTRRGAIRKAARAIRQTSRPAGLVVWRGAHSWVMSGFTATADPAYDNGFKVKAAYIQDTWYPYVSTIWGASDPPNTLVPVARLKEDFLPYQRPRARHPKRDGKFMLILPVLPRGTVAR